MDGRAALHRISRNCGRPEWRFSSAAVSIVRHWTFWKCICTHTHSRHRIFRGKMRKASAKNTNQTGSSSVFRFTTPNSLRSLRVLLFRITKNNYFFNGKREGKKLMMEKQNVRAERNIFIWSRVNIFSRKHVFRGPRDALPRWLVNKQAKDALKHWVTPQLACDETKIISARKKTNFTTSQRAATPICTLSPTTPQTSGSDSYVFSLRSL